MTSAQGGPAEGLGGASRSKQSTAPATAIHLRLARTPPDAPSFLAVVCAVSARRPTRASIVSPPPPASTTKLVRGVRRRTVIISPSGFGVALCLQLAASPRSNIPSRAQNARLSPSGEWHVHRRRRGVIIESSLDADSLRASSSLLLLCWSDCVNKLRDRLYFRLRRFGGAGHR